MRKLILFSILFVAQGSLADISKTVTLEELGKTLFFDPRLSGSNLISCASCHNPNLGWSDGVPKGVGHNGAQLSRRTPHLYDVADNPRFFWDGRAASLEEQALLPIQNPMEMNQNINELIIEISGIAGYREMFYQHFPNQEIRSESIASALAAFQSTIRHGWTPFERLMEGDSSVPRDILKGYRLFTSQRTRCADCHMLGTFSDGLFHDIGVDDEDAGRGEFFPDFPKLQHTFKTPILWNVAKHPPYFHDGSAPNLEKVIEHYSVGGGVERESKDFRIRPLNLSVEEKRLLLVFLNSLTEEQSPQVDLPELPK